MNYETDNVAVFVLFLIVFLALIGMAAYNGLTRDWVACVLGGASVYLLGCIKINGKTIHG
jgi:hypothetical protein